MTEPRVLGALARSAALLSDNTFAGTVALAPALMLQVIPQACRVEVTVTHPEQVEPMHKVASRTRSWASPAPLPTQFLSLDIALTPGTVAGHLLLSTDADEGFDVPAQLAAKVMVTQVEAGLRCAYAVERARSLVDALRRSEEVAVATGLIMASEGVGREAASALLEKHARATGHSVVGLAREVIRVGTAAPDRRAPLHLVASQLAD